MTIEQKVKQIIGNELGIDPSTLKLTDEITGNLGGTAAQKAAIIADFEAEWSITIPPADADTIRTVGDAIDYLEKHV